MEFNKEFFIVTFENENILIDIESEKEGSTIFIDSNNKLRKGSKLILEEKQKNKLTQIWIFTKEGM
jgi:hypothetical protein